MEARRVKVGPFTWEQKNDAESECWVLVSPEGLNMTYWYLKDYGGEPNDRTAFSGIRLGSGGPFTQAGGWTNMRAAMVGVIPYLILQYRSEIDSLHKRHEEMLRAMNAAEAELGKFEREIARGEEEWHLVHGQPAPGVTP